MEAWMLLDAQATYAIQQLLPLSTIEGLATSCSKLGDPRYAYSVMFPVMFWLVGPAPGGMVLLAAALAEWMNISLKWLLQGDRPYWWVGVHADLWNSSQPLVQVPITCETGPGMPSGHVMISLTVLLCCCYYVHRESEPGSKHEREGGFGGNGLKQGEVVVGMLLRRRPLRGVRGGRDGCHGLNVQQGSTEKAVSDGVMGDEEGGDFGEKLEVNGGVRAGRNNGEVRGRCRWVEGVSQCAIVVFSAAIGVTRVLVSSHFIHQVLLGVMVGILLYRIITTSIALNRFFLWTTPNSSPPLCVLSFLLFSSGMFLYWSLIYMNFDPAFSVQLAQEYCQHSSWVHLNTTPFFSLVRSSGTVLGMSLVALIGMQVNQNFGTRKNVFGRARVSTITSLIALALTVEGSVLLGQIDVKMSLLGDELLGFYTVSLIKAALVPLLTVTPTLLL